jgi:hypothetical protein
MIDLIKNYEASKPKKHPVGMTSHFGTSITDLDRSNADWISPAGADVPYDFLRDPRPADGRKVVILDSDHVTYFDAYSGMIWKWFTRGMNPIFIDLAPPLRDKAPLPEQDLIRGAMGYTRAYADKMNLAAMTPRGDLTSTGYALANPGSEYLVYQPRCGPFTLNLQAGTYIYEWFNPMFGSVAQGGTVIAFEGSQSFTPPFIGEAVLYLKSGPGKTGAGTLPAHKFHRTRGDAGGSQAPSACWRLREEKG